MLGNLYSNGPAGILATGSVTTEPMVTFPVSLIPTFLVPLFLLLHGLVFVRVKHLDVPLRPAASGLSAVQQRRAPTTSREA
ncbi:MAG: hypothetical protein ACRD2Z_02930 [Thermoanaerobaculia bacterium]